MGTLSYIIQRVHSKWDQSIQAITNPGETVELVREVLDELVTELNLSTQSWLVPRFTLTVDAGTDTYAVPVGDFGRLQLVVAVSTTGTAQARPIDIVDEPQLIGYFHGGDQGPSGITNSAEACCLIFKDGQAHIKFGPIPNATGEYLVIYEPDQVHPQGLNKSAFRMPQFDGYLADRVAFKGLPYQRWKEFEGMDAVERLKANQAKRAEIRETLGLEIARADVRFRRFRQSDRQTDTFRARPYGARRWKRARYY